MAQALVTGGSSGIGQAFATELASRGFDLVLVGRDGARLTETANQLSNKWGISCEMLTADLQDHDDIERVAKRVASQEKPIEILVNNAGHAVNRALLDADLDVLRKDMSLMCLAVAGLSAAAGKAMVARGSGQIINVSSVSAWILKGNYSAIKRWVLTYTEALAAELDGTGVNVCAVCPGWVKTDFHARGGVKQPKLPHWLWVPAKAVAKEALAGVAKGRTVVVPTVIWRIIAKFLQLAPASVPRYISKRIIRSRKGS